MNLPLPHYFDVLGTRSHRGRNKFRAPGNFQRGRTMRATRIAITLAASLACGIAMQQAASAQEYRGTLQQQLACTADVLSLCGDQIPDTNRIVACLRQNTPQLSEGCRAVFDSNASVPQQASPQQPSPVRRGDLPRRAEDR
jgi:hypothetical protein